MLKITFFLIVYLIFVLLYEIRNIKKQRKTHNAGYWAFKIAFYVYILLLIKATIFPIPFQKLELESLRKNFGRGFETNLIPMKSIINIIHSNANFSVKFRQIAGNLILLFPLAFYLPFIKEKYRSIGKSFLALLTTACMIEIIQFLIGKIIDYNYRVVDVDDVILNVCGGMVGYFMWKIFHKYLEKNFL